MKNRASSHLLLLVLILGLEITGYLAIHRAGLEKWTAMPEGFWGRTRLPDKKAQ